MWASGFTDSLSQTFLLTRGDFLFRLFAHNLKCLFCVCCGAESRCEDFVDDCFCSFSVQMHGVGKYGAKQKGDVVSQSSFHTTNVLFKNSLVVGECMVFVFWNGAAHFILW